MGIRRQSFVLGSLAAVWFAGSFSLGTPALASPVQVRVESGEVRDVMMSLARMEGLSLIFDEDISGQVTISATAEPEQLLQQVAVLKGLVLVREGNSYLVTLPTKAAALKRVHVYHVRHADPHELAQAARLVMAAGNPAGESAPEATGAAERILVDNATNSLLLYGDAAEVHHTLSLLEELDVEPRQVSLEAKVVAISKDAAKQLGIEWQWSSLPRYPEHSETYRHKGTNREEKEYEIHRDTGGDGIPGIIQFGRGPEGIPFEFYYGAKLNALVSDGKAKILARPNITTLQGREAVINIGGEVPVPTQTVNETSTTTTFSYRQAGIILRCRPRLHGDGLITAEVHTEVSSPLYVADIKAYRFQNRRADTTVSLKDGETMVIGGLIGSEESRTMSKIPFLGDLPILGNFFRSIKKSHSESEVMIFLTAHALPCDDAETDADHVL
ncbi:MAG: secretin N-terminal domain-containing protein [Selenomonadaceae bacterium]|nr:secretin N-terminal domain-containing protein [Selenomonadaceae bacterium]